MIHSLTLNLKYAAMNIEAGNLNTAMIDLKGALRKANKMKRRDLQSLIFRAMNHIRSAQAIAK